MGGVVLHRGAIRTAESESLIQSAYAGVQRIVRVRLGSRVAALATRGQLECPPLLRLASRIRTLDPGDLHQLHRHCFHPEFWDLWQELATRFPTAQVLAHCAILGREHHPEDAVGCFADALRQEPGIWFAFGDDRWLELADELDEEAALDFRIARLLAYVGTAPLEHADEVGELYSELLALCADDSGRTAQVRAIGKQMDSLVSEGVLPRTFVMRGASRQ